MIDFPRTSTCLWLSSTDAASSSFFSSRALPSSAARMRSVSVTPPPSLLPGWGADGGRAKESDREEDEERGKKESSRVGEGRLVFLEVNMSLQLVDVTSRTWSPELDTEKTEDWRPVSCFPVGLVQSDLINLLLCQAPVRR